MLSSNLVLVADAGKFVVIQAMTALQSDAAFRVIEERIKSKPDIQNVVNAMCLFDITVDGRNAAYWSMNKLTAVLCCV